MNSAKMTVDCWFAMKKKKKKVHIYSSFGQLVQPSKWDGFCGAPWRDGSRNSRICRKTGGPSSLPCLQGLQKIFLSPRSSACAMPGVEEGLVGSLGLGAIVFRAIQLRQWAFLGAFMFVRIKEGHDVYLCIIVITILVAAFFVSPKKSCMWLIKVGFWRWRSKSPNCLFILHNWHNMNLRATSWQYSLCSPAMCHLFCFFTSLYDMAIWRSSTSILIA